MLEVDGGNWPIFRRKFKTHMDSAGLDEHFAKDNVPADSYEKIEAKPIKKDKESDDDYQKRVDVWTDGEAMWKKGAKTWKKETLGAKHSFLPAEIVVKKIENCTRFSTCGNYILFAHTMFHVKKVALTLFKFLHNKCQ
jgi:hypothetical protein